MQPTITRVRWSAQNIPWGMKFDESTGTFSGKPEDVGVYPVFLTVETEYGSDSTYVTIIVEAPEDQKPVITPDQIITIAPDTEMEAYQLQGTNVNKTA